MKRCLRIISGRLQRTLGAGHRKPWLQRDRLFHLQLMRNPAVDFQEAERASGSGTSLVLSYAAPESEGGKRGGFASSPRTQQVTTRADLYFR